jgi:lipopolysaccharide transport system ATP-binding protein
VTTAIEVEAVAKRYVLGEQRAAYDTLRDDLVHAAQRLAGRSRDRPEPQHVWALDGVNFSVAEGEVLGLIGHNGAGKTTLLRVLSRITEPTRGEIRLRGRVASLLEVGTGFHPELTGRENVYLNGAILGMRRREIVRKFDEIVEFAGVEPFIDTPVKRYSSGMHVRLAFSVAAHLEPEILLVDEVLAVGDAEFQRRCLGKLETIGGSGRTVIFVSHSMPSILRLCERAILLNRGSVVADGPADRVVGQYLAGESGSGAHRTWDEAEAPGNDLARLRSVRVVNEDGATIEAADARRPVGIEIAFDVRRSEKPIVPTITLYNDHGVHVFNALDPSPRWAAPPLPGRYRAVAWIPPRLLNEGRLVVSVLIVTLGSGKSEKHVNAADAVAFTTVDPGGEGSAKGPFTQQWGGAVAPLLEWSVEREDADHAD